MLRLRLAARAIVEWRLSANTKEYQKIIYELLEVHPRAKLWGLSLDSPLFDIDVDGAVLWFLSEKMPFPNSLSDLNRTDDVGFLQGLFQDEKVNDLRRQISDRLIEFATAHAAKMTSEDYRSRNALADYLFNAISDDYSLDTNALYAVLAITLPDGDPTRETVLTDLRRRSLAFPHPNNVQIIDRKPAFNIMWEAVAIISVAGFFGVLSILTVSGLALFITGGRPEISLPAILFIAIACFVFLIFHSYVNGPLGVFVRDAINERASLKKARAYFLVTKAVKARAEQGSTTSEELFLNHQLYFLLINLLAEISHERFSLFKALVLSDSLCSPYLKQLLLATAQWIHVEDARVLLREIRNSEITFQSKAYLFQWLCRARLIEYWQPNL